MTEHQLIERECGCGHRTKGAAPPGRRRRCSTGRGSRRSSCTCTPGSSCRRSAPRRRWPNCSASRCRPGRSRRITARAAGRLDGFLEQVREQIAASEVAGFDETGFRVEGRLHWVHCARTGKYTLLMVPPQARHGRRSRRWAFLPRFAGVAVHDAWAPYDTYTAPDHQLCCAHALRELQAVTDAAPQGQWCWATQAAEALTAMQDLVREAISQGRDAVDPAALAARSICYRSAALAGASETAARSGRADEKAQRARPAPARPPGRLPAIHHRTGGYRPITTDVNATSA